MEVRATLEALCGRLIGITMTVILLAGSVQC